MEFIDELRSSGVIHSRGLPSPVVRMDSLATAGNDSW